MVEDHVIKRGDVTRIMAEHGVMGDAGRQLDNVNQLFGRLGGRPHNSEPDGNEDNQ